MTTPNPIKVLIVDDSAVVRQAMAAIMGKDRGIKVIGHAMDPIFAMDKMAKEWPDVILLDVEMPRMDGITFLRKIMAEKPTPVPRFRRSRATGSYRLPGIELLHDPVASIFTG